LLKEKGDEKGIRSEIDKLVRELSELKTKTLSISEDELKEYNNLKNFEFFTNIL